MTGSLPDANVSVLPPLPAGWKAVTYAPLADGTLATLATNREFDGRAAVNARIWTFDGNTLLEGPTFFPASRCPVIDRFADGRWLVTDARQATAPMASFSRLTVARFAASIWATGFFGQKLTTLTASGSAGSTKECSAMRAGVCRGLEWPPSSYGLAGFDQLGGLVAHAEGVPERSAIADCYALNVFGNNVWVCTYPDFPIGSQTVGDPWRWWTTQLSGTRAIAVEGAFVLAAGGYGEDGNRVVLLRLGDDGLESLAEWRLPLMGGFPH
jgi:hypothetical protein